jgi:DNA-binding LytR/AlgR family response regulator
MQIKCVAIDDEPLALELIREYLSGFPQLQLMYTFNDAVSGGEYVRKNEVDLLFVDINMPDITGIELVKSLQEKPAIIFTTAYKNFAHEGFELDAVDYMLKPISRERFAKGVNKAIEYIKYKKTAAGNEQDALFVYSEYKLVKILLEDIEYIESMEDYIRIHLAGSKPIMCLMPLKKVLEKLPSQKFKRIHRSYIVPVKKVKALQNKKLELRNGTELPVSDSYAGFIREWKKQ